ISNSGSATVNVNTNPATPTITPTQTPVCANSTGNQASGPAGASSYAWTITNGTITSGANSQTVTYTAGATGNVSLTLMVTNAASCSASSSATVPINTAPGCTVIAPTVYSGRFSDPLVCLGPGGTVAGTIQLNNPNPTALSFTLNTTLTNMVGVPGSCTLTGA